MAHDLLTKEEDAMAAKHGYGIYHVYTLEHNSFSVQILPTDKIHHVMSLAQRGDEVALKALKAVIKFRGK